MGFVVCGFDGRLLMAEDFHLFEPLVPRVELHSHWVGIIYARWELRAERIFIEDDFAIIIGWIQGGTKKLEAHLLIRNILTFLHHSAAMSI